MAENRFNIVMVISDQQRFDTLVPNGRLEAKTPHLDRLLGDGVNFSHAFCTAPMCSPARTSILSGLYPHSHGMVANHQHRPGCDDMRLRPEIALLPDYLNRFGYSCAYSGKWHLGTGSSRRGFLDIHGKLGDHDVDSAAENDYLQFANKAGLELSGKQDGSEPDPDGYDPRIITGRSKYALAYHPSHFCCTRAIRHIETCAEKGQPFCLVFSTREPHPPFMAPEPFYSWYDPEEIKLPSNFGGTSGDAWLTRGCRQLKSIRDIGESDVRRMWAAYMGAVSYVDHLVGCLVAALHDTDSYRDTLIVFTSDHGEMLGSHGLRAKGATLCEELVRVPLIMKMPGERRSTDSMDDLVSHADLLPTFLDLLGVEIPSTLQGRSFAGALDGIRPSRRIHEGVVSEFHSSNWTDPVFPMRMWRTRDWKYIETKKGDHELYDLREDPGELSNLIDDPHCAEPLNRLKRQLHDWMNRNGDDFPDVPVATR